MAKKAWGRQDPVAVLLGGEHGSPGASGEDVRVFRAGFVISADRMGTRGGGAACAEEGRGRGLLAGAESQDQG